MWMVLLSQLLELEAKRLFRYENDLGKTDEKTAHVGQFADIVKGGGHEDYEAWQRNTKGMSEKRKNGRV